MSNKATVQPQAIKEPRTVRVREIIPWGIVTVFTALTIGLIVGWFIHADMLGDVQAQAVQLSK